MKRDIDRLVCHFLAKWNNIEIISLSSVEFGFSEIYKVFHMIDIFHMQCLETE